MLSYIPDSRRSLLPHRAPGSPGLSRKTFLSGKPITYYRPTGSAEIRHLVDEGFQAFNAGRLSKRARSSPRRCSLPRATRPSD